LLGLIKNAFDSKRFLIQRFKSGARVGNLIIDQKTFLQKNLSLGSRGQEMGHWRPGKAWKPIQNKWFEQKSGSICNQKLLKTIGNH
jgi:hypothetical protein